MPLVVTVAAFKSMVLAVTFNALRLTVPTAPPKTTLPPVLLAVMFKDFEAAVSASKVLATVIIELASLAARLALAATVIAPV